MDRTLVAISCYNEGANIEKTIEYVVHELSTADILVIDDSTDLETLKILNDIRQSNLRILHRNSRGGQNTAYNAAVSYCLDHDYEWLLFVEADLIIPNGTLHRFAEYYERSNYDVVNCPNYPLPTESRLSFGYANYVKWSLWLKLRKNKLVMPSRIILIRSSCLKKVFPIPDWFLDVTYWINGSALRAGFRVYTSWIEKAFFLPPQNFADVRMENLRYKFSSNQIAENFPEMQSIFATRFVDLLVSFITESLDHPQYILALPWLLCMYSGLCMQSEYQYGTRWIPHSSTKNLRSRRRLSIR